MHLLRHNADIEFVAAVIGEAIEAEAVVEPAQQGDVVLEPNVGAASAAPAAAATASGRMCSTAAATASDSSMSASAATNGSSASASAAADTCSSAATAAMGAARARETPLTLIGVNTRPVG